MGKTLVGVMLLLFGSLLFLNVLGLGWVFRLFISLFIIIYAINKLKKAETSTQKAFASIILLFGIFLFFGGVPLLFGILVGLALIFLGVSLLKRANERDTPKDNVSLQGNSAIYDDAFDMEWNKKMRK